MAKQSSLVEFFSMSLAHDEMEQGLDTLKERLEASSQYNSDIKEVRITVECRRSEKSNGKAPAKPLPKAATE